MKAKAKIALLACTALLATGSGAWAQVTTDGSVGAVVSQTGTSISIPQSLGLTNSSGTTVLHSFSQFDLVQGQTATFSGSNSLTAIIARITGNAPSSIDGTITSSAPNANLYFLNPRGVVFGANAVVNVPAGFYVSTGDALNFSDGSAITMTATPVGTLTTASIASFGFHSAGAGDITVNGSSLTTGGDLSLIGNNVTVEQSSASPNPAGEALFATGASATQRGELRFAAVGDPTGTVGLRGTVPLTGGVLTVGDPALGDADTLGLTTHSSVGAIDRYYSGGTVNVTGFSSMEIDTNSDGSTDTLTITGGNLTLSNFDSLQSGQNVGPATPPQGGAFTFDMTGNIVMSNGGLWVSSYGKPGGSVTITAASLTMTNAVIYDSGDNLDGGTVNIHTTGDFTMDNSDIAAAAVGVTRSTYTVPAYDPQNPGNAGNIALNVGGALTLKNGSFLDVASESQSGTNGGKAGTITITSGTLTSTDSGMFFYADTGGRAGGTVIINTGNATISGEATDSYWQGDLNVAGTFVGYSRTGTGGNVTVNVANGPLTIENANIDVGSQSSGAGNGGNVAITAQALTIGGSTRIASAAGAAGQGGNLLLQAQSMTVGDPAATAPAGQAAPAPVIVTTGADGSIIIRAANLTVQNAQVSSMASQGTTGSGNAGTISIYANTLTITDGATVETTAGGDGGTITLGGNTVEMASGATVSTSGQTGGVIRVGADNRLTIDDGAKVTSSVATAGQSGQSGNIYIGTTLGTPVTVNAACDSNCQAFQPYTSPTTPGTRFGVPIQYQSGSSAQLQATGGTGAVIYGFGGGQETPDAVDILSQTPGVTTQALAQSSAESASGASSSGGVSVGIYYFNASDRAASSVCSAADAAKKGDSTLAVLLMNVNQPVSDAMTMELYAAPGTAGAASARLSDPQLDDCLKTLMPDVVNASAPALHLSDRGN